MRAGPFGPAPPLPEVRAGDADRRACLLELRGGLQERHALEGAPHRRPLPSELRPECRGRPRQGAPRLNGRGVTRTRAGSPPGGSLLQSEAFH